uniref:Protein strawberry notch homolog 1 n=1 Tax=Oncorhynchus mykiss TaxID=8022 RepID=A0A8C7PX46_ONCMY
MDPGQDLLLAALSESGICPNDLFDFDPQDMFSADVSFVSLLQSISINALGVGSGMEAMAPPTPAVSIRHKPQPSTTTFVLNQLNQLPSLGTIVVTKPSTGGTARHTITVTKVVHSAPSALRGSSSTLTYSTALPSPVSTVVPSNREQIQLKDLLRTGSTMKSSSLVELMRLKPPPDIAQPVATATATAELNNGIKKEVSSKDVARIWVNDDMKVRSFSPTLVSGVVQSLTLDQKVRIGLRHPDPVVETSSLSSVKPPNVWYRMSIPEETVDRGWLSALQLEAITYAAQQHETFLPNGDRASYLIGDGAGVGKGRTIAGIIYENYLLGRKRSLWFSVSNDLKYDAERDLKDIGAKNIQVHSLNKFKYGKISSKHNGSVKKGVIFATYSSLIGESQSGGKYKTRFKQLLHWCGEDFDGVIVYDECHKAKNVCPIGSSKPTKTGLAVLELQNKLPKARVVYASATGASEPRNMAYMNRLGIWGEGTPFREFSNFIQAVERRGVGAMEIVAMDMKLRGMYIARQLSFTGVTFKIEEVPLTTHYIKMYNKSVRLWVAAREKFQAAANLMEAEQRMKKSMWGQFWSAHQRFFKYLCIASKVRRVVQLAREEVKNGKCVVIGLQSTGEARTLEALEEGGGELNDFVSTAKGVLQSLIEKHFPAPDRQKLFSLLGIDLSVKKTPSPSEAAAEQKGKKRKGAEIKKPEKRKRKSGGLSGSSSDDSESEESDKDDAESDDSFKSVSSGEDDDDFNPFKDDSSEDEEDDPWLSGKRKEAKKGKEKMNKKKKKKKSIDPDSIHSALLASGLGSIRPAFTTPIVKTSSTPAIEADDSCMTSQDAVEDAQQMKRDLLDQLEKLAQDLPPNTLDELIDELGGPDNVAEMTGRKGRVVSNDDGSISYESRSELDVPVEILNLTEKQRFMDGEKNIAIISEAASSGISLQADRRVKNQRRRVHMTLELPWSADRAIQQFGRTHRSNQVTAPEYVFLISELAGEQRFASIVAKRLESLGALTHGDRRATETRDLSRFNFDNKYGRNALEIVMKSIVNLDSPLVNPPSDFEGDFYKEIRHGLIGVGLINVEDRSGILSLDKDYNNIGKFLNRILGMAVQEQNALFQYFSDTLAAVIQNAKKNGRYDMGILDLGSGDEKVKKIEAKKFLTPGYSTSGHVELYTVSVERGMSWEDATHAWAEQSGPDDGFYVQIRNNKKTAILVQEVNSKKRLFLVYRPNTGKQLKLEAYTDIKKKCKKVLSDDAKQHWIDQYKSSAEICAHAYWRGNCKKASVGLQCEVGLRCRTYYVLCGSVLSVWTKVEGVLASVSGTNVKMQIVRLRTEDGQRIVGLIIPANCVSPLTNILSSSDQSQQLAVQQQQKWQQLHPQSLSHVHNT